MRKSTDRKQLDGTGPMVGVNIAGWPILSHLILGILVFVVKFLEHGKYTGRGLHFGVSSRCIVHENRRLIPIHGHAFGIAGFAFFHTVKERTSLHKFQMASGPSSSFGWTWMPVGQMMHGPGKIHTGFLLLLLLLVVLIFLMMRFFFLLFFRAIFLSFITINVLIILVALLMILLAFLAVLVVMLLAAFMVVGLLVVVVIVLVLLMVLIIAMLLLVVLMAFLIFITLFSTIVFVVLLVIVTLMVIMMLVVVTLVMMVLLLVVAIISICKTERWGQD